MSQIPGRASCRNSPWSPFERYHDAVVAQAAHPILLVGALVLDFLAIHPVADGNGRLARPAGGGDRACRWPAKRSSLGVEATGRVMDAGMPLDDA